MTAIMIFHVRSKFTAVGRKEILTFFYLYVLLTIVSLVLDAGVLPATKDGAFVYFVSVQNGLTSAMCAALLINGFVGFQLYEDGTFLSVWLLRLSSVAVFALSFIISLLTFQGWAGLSPTNTTGLFIVLYIVNAICLFVYLVMQVILVVNTLQDRWPLWDLAAAVFFFVIGQLIVYTFGTRICEAVNHYLDGLFFATVCNLLAVMMIYKVCLLHSPPRPANSLPERSANRSVQYWDSITREDLEFSVGARQNNWDVSAASAMQKDPLLSASEVDMVHNDHRASYYPSGPDPYHNGGGNRGSTYADSTYNDYRPQTSGAGSLYGNNSHGRNQSSTHLGAPVETRQPKRLSDYGGARYGEYTAEQAGAYPAENERAVRRKSLANTAAVQVYEDYGNDQQSYAQAPQQERRRRSSRGPGGY